MMACNAYAYEYSCPSDSAMWNVAKAAFRVVRPLPACAFDASRYMQSLHVFLAAIAQCACYQQKQDILCVLLQLIR
jgi:hypothetical protein